MTEQESGIHGVAVREDPSSIYLLLADVLSLLDEHRDKFEALIVKAKMHADTESGRLQIAALVGASAVLQSVTQQLDLLGIEMATEADEIIQEEEEGASG